MQSDSSNDPEDSPLMEPNGTFRKIIFDVVNTMSFELTIAALIVANVIAMACESNKYGAWQATFLAFADVFFNFCFGAEACAKLYCLYPRQYLNSSWNRFDFTVVIVSYIGIAFDLSGSTIAINPTILRVLRIFRLFRLLRAFRIFKAAEGLQVPFYSFLIPTS